MQPTRPPIEHDQRQPRVARAERFVQLLDRKRRVRVHAAVALVVRALGRRDQRGRIVELGHQAVDRELGSTSLIQSSSTFASGRIVRISKIEIIGRKRRNRNNSERNRPIVPRNVDQSQNVGAVHPPRRGQEVAMQAGDDDDEALEPHADVHDQRDDEQQRHVGAHPLQPQHLRHDDVAEDAAPSSTTRTGRSCGSAARTPSYLSPLYQAMNASVM